MEVRNKRLSDEEFARQRKEVLAGWPTGKEVNLDEAVQYHKTLLPDRNYALKVADAKQQGRHLIRIDSGVATLEGEIGLFKCLQDEGGADLLGTIVDSFSRLLEFKKAEDGLKESARLGRTALNGFPIVNHGVARTRKVIESVKLPVQLRSPAVDTRLVLEMALASGHTSVAGGAAISNIMSFSKHEPPEIDIRNGQYNFRLLGEYQQKGIPVSAEPGWGFPHTTPYSLGFAQGIINILAAAEQGVKYFNFGIYGQTGNLALDVAALTSMPKLGNEYLKRLGYRPIETAVMSSCYGGTFPEDISESYAIICLSAVTAMLGGAQIIHVKTIWEGKTIPSMEASAASLRAGKKVIDMLKDQKIGIDPQAVALEAEMLEMETHAIMDRILELGDGDVVVGYIKGLESGIIDPPFATSSYARGQVIAARDNEGAMRYLDFGNLPFNQEIKDFHRQKLAEREKAQGRKIDYKNVVDDLLCFSKGPLVTH
ncbi:MAG: methylaspartate mutase subunit E [Dehalococcoidales bacterium]|nr:methylaspartate mutase subunit E [Dehalococcoidales bacterium]